MVTYRTNIRWKGVSYAFELKHRDMDFVEYPNIRAKCNTTADGKQVGTTADDEHHDGGDNDNDDDESSEMVDDDDMDDDTLVFVLTGALLHRPSGVFLEEADAVSQELHELSVIFCDSRGIANRIKHPKLVEDKDAVNSGGFLHIYSMETKPSHRHQDLGLRVLHEVLVQLSHKWTLAVARPESLGFHLRKWREGLVDPDKSPPAQDGARSQADEKLRRHFMRFGFAQAGRSPDLTSAFFLTSQGYFGREAVADNKEKNIEERWTTKTDSESFELFEAPVQREPTGVDKELFDLVQVMATSNAQVDPSKQEEQMKPVHSLLSRGASVQVSRALFVAAEMEAKDNYVLRELLYAATAADAINAQDEKGNTPLHQAAGRLRAHNIDLLLAAGASRNATNLSGETPLQVLQATLQRFRDMGAAFGLKKMPPQEVHVKLKLDCLNRLMPLEERSHLWEGWMSPRMHEVLLTEAEIDSDQFLHNSFCRLDYIPDSVTQRRSENFRAGWAVVWEAAARVVRGGAAPTVNRIRAELDRLAGGKKDRDYKAFLRKGGRIEYAVDAIISQAESVCVGDGGGWELETFEEEIEKHPMTALDEAFDVAWHKCIRQGGGEGLERRGPYRLFYEDEAASREE